MSFILKFTGKEKDQKRTRKMRNNNNCNNWRICYQNRSSTIAIMNTTSMNLTILQRTNKNSIRIIQKNRKIAKKDKIRAKKRKYSTERKLIHKTIVISAIWFHNLSLKLTKQ